MIIYIYTYICVCIYIVVYNYICMYSCVCVVMKICTHIPYNELQALRSYARACIYFFAERTASSPACTRRPIYQAVTTALHTRYSNACQAYHCGPYHASHLRTRHSIADLAAAKTVTESDAAA